MTKLNQLTAPPPSSSSQRAGRIVRFDVARVGLPWLTRGRVARVDEPSSVEAEPGLRGELERLESRLAQGQRDHQRSHDDLRRLEGEIRLLKSELRMLSREHETSPAE